MTNNGPREIPMMMKSFLMPMVLDGSKWKSRRIGEQWKRVKVGDRVWMREAWAPCPDVPAWNGRKAFYCADGRPPYGGLNVTRWTPAVHMPRSVCRFIGEVTGTRQERLQDITEGDAEAEGMCSITSRDLCAVFSIRAVNMAMRRIDLVQNWNSPAYRFAVLMECMTPGIWAKNPEVTVVEWRKV